MLHILTVIFILFLLLNPASARANFFEEKDTPVQESGCSECSKETVNLNPDLKEKVAAIEKTVSSNFDRKENHSNNEITLFIDPECGYSDAAVKVLLKF